MKPADFFASFKSLWGGAVVAASAGPLSLWVMELEPPWPASVGKVATLFCAVAVLFAFIASGPLQAQSKNNEGTSSRGSKQIRRLRFVSIASVALGLLGLMCYLWAYGHFVVTDSIERGGRSELIRVVAGTELRPGLDANTTNVDLLRDNLYEPESIWTTASINNARMLLLISFVLSFSALTFGVAVLAPLESAKGDSKVAAEEKSA